MDDREFLNKIRKIQGSDNKISLTEMTVDSVTPPFENKKKQHHEETQNLLQIINNDGVTIQIKKLPCNILQNKAVQY